MAEPHLPVSRPELLEFDGLPLSPQTYYALGRFIARLLASDQAVDLTAQGFGEGVFDDVMDEEAGEEVIGRLYPHERTEGFQAPEHLQIVSYTESGKRLVESADVQGWMAKSGDLDGEIKFAKGGEAGDFTGRLAFVGGQLKEILGKVECRLITPDAEPEFIKFASMLGLGRVWTRYREGHRQLISKFYSFQLNQQMGSALLRGLQKIR